MVRVTLGLAITRSFRLLPAQQQGSSCRAHEAGLIKSPSSTAGTGQITFTFVMLRPETDTWSAIYVTQHNTAGGQVS